MARAIYRKGRASHSDELRDARKVLFYAQAEVERLEKLHKPVIRELYTEADQEKARAMIAAAWEEGEERMEQIGRNSGDGLHYGKEWQTNIGSALALPGRTKVEVEFVLGGRCIGEVEEFMWGQGPGASIARWRIFDALR